VRIEMLIKFGWNTRRKVVNQEDLDIGKDIPVTGRGGP
jgi:hypothetical protein